MYVDRPWLNFKHAVSRQFVVYLHSNFRKNRANARAFFHVSATESKVKFK